MYNMNAFQDTKKVTYNKNLLINNSKKTSEINNYSYLNLGNMDLS